MDAVTSRTIEAPFDYLRLSLDEDVLIKCRGDRVLKGKLQAFDEHLNVALTDVEEKRSFVSIDEETGEEVTKAIYRTFDFLVVRGDVIILLTKQ